MQKIAEAHLYALEHPAKLPTRADIIRAIRKYWLVFSFGLLSVILYSLLYYFSADLTNIAQATHAGHKAMFFVPIVLALVFSMIHGAFTAHFWDVLGVKPKK